MLAAFMMALLFCCHTQQRSDIGFVTCICGDSCLHSAVKVEYWAARTPASLQLTTYSTHTLCKVISGMCMCVYVCKYVHVCVCVRHTHTQFMYSVCTCRCTHLHMHSTHTPMHTLHTCTSSPHVHNHTYAPIVMCGCICVRMCACVE